MIGDIVFGKMEGLEYLKCMDCQWKKPELIPSSGIIASNSSLKSLPLRNVSIMIGHIYSQRYYFGFLDPINYKSLDILCQDEDMADNSFGRHNSPVN